jgi:hypothetical protein
MSNEQLVEEILYESYSLGVYDEVMSLSKKMKETNPRMSIYDRYNDTSGTNNGTPVPMKKETKEERQLAQMIRRKMIQKDHGDKKKFDKKLSRSWKYE